MCSKIVLHLLHCTNLFLTTVELAGISRMSESVGVFIGGVADGFAWGFPPFRKNREKDEYPGSLRGGRDSRSLDFASLRSG
jgi:hypothetical protein